MDTILILDNAADDLKLLQNTFHDTYDVIAAKDAAMAVEMLEDPANRISLILFDIIDPDFGGVRMLKCLQTHPVSCQIPIILISSPDLITEENCSPFEGAIDFLVRPLHPAIVRCRIRNHINLKHKDDRLREMTEQRSQKILQMRETVLDSVTSIIEYRSLESGQHVRRIRMYSSVQLEYMLKNGLCPEILGHSSAEIIAHASSLHDIGKVAISDSILKKPGKLTPEEYEIMKTHTLVGSDFIDSLSESESEEYFFFARQICRHHHERWDGLGYPDALEGEYIPFSARVVAVADVYDALTSKRVYKPAFSHEEAVRIIRQGRGTQFDPLLVDVFLANADRFRDIACINSDDDNRYPYRGAACSLSPHLVPVL